MKHSIMDCDRHFEIDPVSRVIKSLNQKTSIVQFDHNSERLTFSIPRYVEGHDMTECTNIEVHYSNVDADTKEKSVGVYPVTDMQKDPNDEERAICTWLISQNATQKVGLLQFSIRFTCLDKDANILYSWNTGVFSSIIVLESLYNSDKIAEEYVDVFEQWKKELEYDIGAFAPFVGDNGNWFSYDNEIEKHVDTGIHAQGQRGPQGERGIQGAQGEKGNKGDAGPQGERGPQGAQGDKGEKGDKGDQGPKGTKGNDGRDGYSPKLMGELAPVSVAWCNPYNIERCVTYSGRFLEEMAGLDYSFAVFPVDEIAGNCAGKTVSFRVSVDSLGDTPEECLSVRVGLVSVKGILDSNGQKLVDLSNKALGFDLREIFNQEFGGDVWNEKLQFSTLVIKDEPGTTGLRAYSVTMPELSDEDATGLLAVYFDVTFKFGEGYGDGVDYYGGVGNLILSGISVETESGKTWYEWDDGIGAYINTGVKAVPEKGKDYWTEDDKAEIKSYVDEAILGGAW